MPTTVQHRSTFGTGVTNVSLAFASNNAAGNLLVYIGAATALNFPGTAICTDNNSNTVADSGVNPSATGQGQLHLYYVKSCNAGANTAKVTDNNISDPHLHIYEVSGCDTTAPLNASGTLSAGSSASYSVSTSGAAAANDYVIAAFLNWALAGTWTVGSGYGNTETANNSTGGDTTFSEDKVASSAAIQTATATCSSTPTTEVALIATFKASAAGGLLTGIDFTPGALRAMETDYLVGDL